MRIYLALLSASLKGQLSYRRSALLEIVGRVCLLGLEFTGVWLIVGQAGALAGWSRWEIVYLYGVASVGLGLAELGTDGLKDMPELVRSGTLDGILVRPVSPLVQVLGRQCRPQRVGRLLQGAVALAAALWMLAPTPGLVQAWMLVANVLASATVYAAIFVASAATCVFTVHSTEAFHAFTYGGAALTQYPVPIYRPWLRDLFLYVIPVGFASYFPALVVLGKTDVLGLPAVLPWLAPLVAGAFAGVALLWWRFALGRYTSTGS